jgi:pimeloyl-ACP methyl ester carboxylesterase
LTTWGNSKNPKVLFCLHGLTRNGRDFDYLANELKDHYLVVCPDLAGRGQSEWFENAKHYNNQQYLIDMAIVLANFPGREIHWLGTSMGGLIGMVFASDRKSPITRLIMNDVGPTVPQSVLANLGMALASTPVCDTLEEFTQYLRLTYSDFGQLPDRIWNHLAKFDHRRTEDGRYTRNFDPKILANFSTLSETECDFWDYWQLLKCPLLVIKGENSKVLTNAIFDQMLNSGIEMEHRVIPNVGHTPTLMLEEQIQLVKEWLLK